MKKEKKNLLITISFIVLAIAIAFAVMTLTKKPSITTDDAVAKCIGKNSVLYVQLGCSHCEDQKKLFGTNYQYLNTIDCFYQTQKCIADGIEGTPTWVIKGQKYVGVQTVEKLQELTNCNSTI